MSTTATPGLRPATSPTVTDGGLETDLVFHAGVELAHFAAFPLLDHEQGRALLRDYYRGYAEVAVRAGAGLLLETPTWRANPDWGARLGRDAAIKLQRMLNSGKLRMSRVGQDLERYGLLLRSVSVDGRDVGRAMVAAGLAREIGDLTRSWC